MNHLTSLLYLALEDDVEILEVSTYRVYNSLLHLNKYKASGPDGLPNWLLKEFQKSSKPVIKQVSEPKKEPRPISLTSSLSKIAEDVVVNDYIKPAVVKSIDPNQFGTISGSTTDMALISMLHKWLGDTDGLGSTIRVFFVIIVKHLI